MCEKPEFRPILTSFGKFLRRPECLAGAGGIEPPNGGIKIRCLTAWLRPNRLNRNARTMRPARTGSDNARSIEGVRPFQQAGKPNFVRNRLPGSVTLYNRTACAKASR